MSRVRAVTIDLDQTMLDRRVTFEGGHHERRLRDPAPKPRRVVGAKNAGTKAVRMRSRRWPEPPEADVTTEGIAALPDALAGLETGGGSAP